MSQRVIERIRKHQNEGDRQRKKLNRRSKLFYVTCDYIEVNATDNQNGNRSSGIDDSSDKEFDNELEDNTRPGEELCISGHNPGYGYGTKTGLVINVQSEPVHLYHDGTKRSDESALTMRKKRHRKSKLFYVSCDEINVNSILYDDIDASDSVSLIA